MRCLCSNVLFTNVRSKHIAVNKSMMYTLQFENMCHELFIAHGQHIINEFLPVTYAIFIAWLTSLVIMQWRRYPFATGVGEGTKGQRVNHAGGQVNMHATCSRHSRQNWGPMVGRNFNRSCIDPLVPLWRCQWSQYQEDFVSREFLCFCLHVARICLRFKLY
jgi:hypothetical protein